MSSSPSSPSTPSAAAQKEARRRRFFAAISSTPSRDQLKSKSKESSSPTVKNEEPSNQASFATSSSASSAAPLSPALTDKLLDIYHNEATKKSFIPPTPEGEAMATAFSKKIISTPPSQLPLGLQDFQRKVLEIDASMKELMKAPMESLPPELQQLKRETAARLAEKPKDLYGYKEAELRLNQLLRDNGEEELPFEQLNACTGEKDGAQRQKEISLQVRVRMADLKKRKPSLHATVHRMLKEQLSKEPHVEIHFEGETR